MVFTEIESVKKLFNMYNSVFWWRSKSSRNFFSKVKTNAVASDIRKNIVQ